MNEQEAIKLSELACKITSITSVLNGYCRNFENIREIANMIEFTELLNKISNELFDFL